MKRLSAIEFMNLPFGTNITVHIVTEDRDETYNAVVVCDKVYYDDNKSDYRQLISEYIHENIAEVFVK